MKTETVPAFVFRVGCLGCQREVAFPVFWADFYNFGSYRGVKTGAFYRVDLDRIAYGHLDLESQLAQASTQWEGGVPLEFVPDRMTCPNCGVRVGLSSSDLRTMAMPAEAPFEAVLL